MKTFATMLWVLVCLTVPLSGLILVGGMASATGAPQEAVVICLALAVCIIPYVFARAVTEIENLQDTSKRPVEKVVSDHVPVRTNQKYNYEKSKS